VKPVNRRDERMDINVRLDLEAEADRAAILFTDRVERDLEVAFGGKVNANDRPAYQPPRRPMR